MSCARIEPTAVVIDDALGCEVGRLEYVPADRRGILHLPPEQCADMGACIALFTRIDQDVARIDTWAGGILVAVYRRLGSSWSAEDLRP